MNWLSKITPKHGWLDLVVITALLLGFNLIFSAKNIGWLHLNPTPWLFLPLLMGSRYGFTPGIAGAVVAILVVLFGMPDADMFLQQILRDHGYQFAMLFLVGALSGEVRRGYRQKEVRLFAEAEQARDRLKKLDTDLFLVKEAKGELERMIATRDAELSTLDSEIRRLFDAEGDEVYQDILLLLNRQARVADAAIFTISPDGKELIRKALIGNQHSLPDRMLLKQQEMIQLATQKGTTVTIPEFWETGKGGTHDYLIVVPLLDFSNHPIAVLVVTGMPFISLTRKSVYRISLICRWSARVVEITHQLGNTSRFIGGIETQRVYTSEFFRENLMLTLESWRQHSLPSTIVMFTLPGKARGRQSELEGLIMPSIRTGDFAADLGLSIPHLAVLLPLSGERGTGIFVDRILSSCAQKSEVGREIQPKVINIEDFDSIDHVWNELTRNVA
ncbi:MAG: hypothetical protein ACJASX_003649 [Limisphaerales bacterium]